MVQNENVKYVKLKELRTILKTKKTSKNGYWKESWKAPTIPQEQFRSEKLINNDDTLPFISTYNPNNPNVFPKVTGNIWKPPNLENSGEIFPKHILIDWKRQTSNLKRLLCSSKFSKTNFQQFQKQQNVKKLLLFRLHYRGWNCKM